MLTAIGERTTGDIGPGVTCPSFRLHPAIVAQASATLAAMYPGRHWLGLGTGEALNEHIVAGYWPETPERINRMFEAIEIIKKLFGGRGQDVKHDGKFFKLESTRLWTMPDARSADLHRDGRTGHREEDRACTPTGLITVGAPEEKIANCPRAVRGGLSRRRQGPRRLPDILQLHLSWAPTDEEALANAMTEWPNGGMKFPKQDIRSPARASSRWRSSSGRRTSRGGC